MVSTTLTTLAGQTTSSTNHHHQHHHQQHQQPQQYQQQPPHHSSNGSSYSSYHRLQAPATTGASPTVVAGAHQRNHYAHNELENDCDSSNTSNSNCGYQPQQPLTLSQALLSTSPPLDDQINLLFPKCRPKQQQQQQQQLSSSGNRQQHEDSVDINLNSANNTTVAAATAEITGSSSPVVTSINTLSYYKSVNIITQSPPPHSASSHSSESLSSVTPRISTNPFLCAPLTPPTPPTVTSNGGDTDVDGILLTEDEGLQQPPQQKQLIEESVPQTAYPASFYYHTGDTRRSHSYTDMPRKRNSAISVNRQHQHHALLNGISNNNIGNEAASNSHNPFIKEQYWESPTTYASSLLHSPTEYRDEHQQKQQQEQQQLPQHTSARRAYHQQREQLAPLLYSIGQRQTQTQALSQSQNLKAPHVMRAGRSPVTHNLSAVDFGTQHQPTLSASNPCAEGLTPLASHYLYGSKSSLNEHPTDWEPREQRKQRLRDEREREREQERQREQLLLEQQQHLQLQDAHTTRDNHLSHLASAQKHEQQQCKRLVNNDDRLINNTVNESAVSSYGEADTSESWQHLRVTTESNALPSEEIKSSKQQTANKTHLGSQSRAHVMLEPPTRRIVDDDAAYRNGWQLESNYTLAVESRHGIIEYEGSPRRIGFATSNSPAADEPEAAVDTIKATAATPTMAALQTISCKTIAANSLQKTAAHAALAALAQCQPSQQPQANPIRPGFPQRIISPPRELRSSSPTQQQQQYYNYGSNHSNNNNNKAACSDNNAEDTSNDVSEIGTISDLTTPEALITATPNELTSCAATSPPPAAATPTTVTATATATLAATTITAIASNSSAIGTTPGQLSLHTKSSTFDYLYEFSETRKVLEEFFKCPSNDEQPILENGSDVDSIDIQYEFHRNFERDEEENLDRDENEEDDENEEIVDEDDHIEQDYRQQQQQQKHQQQQLQLMQQPLTSDRHVGTYTQPQLQLQSQLQLQAQLQSQPAQLPRHYSGSPLMRDFDFFRETASRSSGEREGEQDGLNHNQLLSTGSGSCLGQSVGQTVSVGLTGTHNYRYSPETTDYDSNCGDLDSLSGEINGGLSTSCSNYAKYYASAMPVLEDGLSSGHTSDTENNNNKNQVQLGVQANPSQTQGLSQSQGQNQGNLSASTSIGGGISMLMDMQRISTNNSLNSMQNLTVSVDSNGVGHQLSHTSPSNGHATQHQQQPSHRSHQRELLGQSPSNNSNSKVFKSIDPELDSLYSINVFHRPDMVQMTPPPPAPAPHRKPNCNTDVDLLQAAGQGSKAIGSTLQRSSPTACIGVGSSTAKPRSASSNCSNNGVGGAGTSSGGEGGAGAHAPPPIPERSNMPVQRSPSPVMSSPVWLSRHLEGNDGKALLESSSDNHSKSHSADEEDVDTDLETDRLLGHQRLDDQGYYDENKSWDRKPRSSLLTKISPKQQQMPSTKTRNGYNALLSSTPELAPPVPPKSSASLSGSGASKLLDLVSGGIGVGIGVAVSAEAAQRSDSCSSSEHSHKSPIKVSGAGHDICGMTATTAADAIVSAVVAAGVLPSHGSSNNGGDLERSATGIAKADTESEGINGAGIVGVASSVANAVISNGTSTINGSANNNNNNNNNVVIGSNNSSGSGAGSNSGEKKVKKSKSKEGKCFGFIHRLIVAILVAIVFIYKQAPDGDVQPSTEVDLFISTEKIMVLNTDLKEIMMDHALRTISYIADIGDLVVLMARRRFVPQDIDDAPKPNRTPKMICHVFESDEAQFIAQSIGQAFQVAYMEFLKANGIEDHRFVKEMDYQEVLNSQEIFGDELEIFAKKELQKEVVVPKAKGEILGVVIVESGWGSMLPTVVIANLMSSGAAARCGQLNIGDQLIAINGLSLVGLPLSTCQTYIKNTKNQTVVKFTVVPCAPVVEVKIKRPETKYQLGFSVQNGVVSAESN
ncbi:PREDICTED: putative mediator of RNA polymerase II transcription subunit 26 [Drosophila arizonae]|uniref:Mediator of RNA polymerase II transcription subunit 26 n=1 Tax=Drosophila arizonae TaxID=7263 RepID=A0ABM1PP79_DROAR|nr:PREDICTED: putative mediator of RNA polymerase II transcription subunit 26 [Drosophila arizonae]